MSEPHLLSRKSNNLCKSLMMLWMYNCRTTLKRWTKTQRQILLSRIESEFREQIKPHFCKTIHLLSHRSSVKICKMNSSWISQKKFQLLSYKIKRWPMKRKFLTKKSSKRAMMKKRLILGAHSLYLECSWPFFRYLHFFLLFSSSTLCTLISFMIALSNLLCTQLLIPFDRFSSDFRQFCIFTRHMHCIAVSRISFSDGRFTRGGTKWLKRGVGANKAEPL